MTLNLKFLPSKLRGLCISTVALALSSVQAANGLSVELTVIDPVTWEMVWAQNLGAETPPVGLTPELAEEIKRRQTVTLVTSIVDGERTATRAITGCYKLTKYIRWKQVTPGETRETILNGQMHFETVVQPTFERTIRWRNEHNNELLVSVIDGKKEYFSWCGPMDTFVFKNVETATYVYTGNQLEWVNEAGVVIARFAKVLPR